MATANEGEGDNLKKFVIQSIKLTGYIILAYFLAVLLAFVYGTFILGGLISNEITAEVIMAVAMNISIVLILYFYMYSRGFKSNEYSDRKLKDLKTFLPALIIPTVLLFLYFIIIEGWNVAAWFYIYANPSGNVGLIRNELIDYIRENHSFMIIISACIHTFLQIGTMALGYIVGYKKRGKKRSKLTAEDFD